MRRIRKAKLFPRSTGAILILVCIVLIQLFDPSVTASLTSFTERDQDVLFTILSGLLFVFYLLYPVIGLFADIKFGRHNVGKAALVVSIFGSMLIIGGELMEIVHDKVPGGFAVFCVGFIIHSLGTTSYYIVMLSYGLDQLTGASADELSAFIQWCYWSYILGWMLTVPFTCSLQNIDKSVFMLYGIHVGCLIIALLIMLLCKSSFTTEFFRSHVNPITLIAKVLKFAKKHKYPVNRSALTYWEDKIPSRLDLGKEKYGGPFAEEEVEDVKTFFRIVPLVFVMVFFYITVERFNPYLLTQNNQGHFERCLISSVYFINCTTILIVMLMYQLILRNMCHRYMPTMLRRITIGIIILILGEIAWLIIDYLGQLKASNTNVCLFGLPTNYTSDDNTDAMWDISYLWMIIPKILMGVGYGITLPTTLEFTYAQSPFSMRGLVVGMWFTATGVTKIIGYNFYYPFKYLLANSHNCTFYYYITKSAALISFLVIYMILAHCYQLRKREQHYNPHVTVEEIYEKDFERRDAEVKQNRCESYIIEEEREKDIHAYLNSLHSTTSDNSSVCRSSNNTSNKSLVL